MVLFILSCSFGNVQVEQMGSKVIVVTTPYQSICQASWDHFCPLPTNILLFLNNIQPCPVYIFFLSTETAKNLFFHPLFSQMECETNQSLIIKGYESGSYFHIKVVNYILKNPREKVKQSSPTLSINIFTLVHDQLKPCQ